MDHELESYLLCTENDSLYRKLGVFQGYEDALEAAKEQAFIRNKLLGLRRIITESELGAPRLVTPSDWIQGRLDPEEMV